MTCEGSLPGTSGHASSMPIAWSGGAYEDLCPATMVSEVIRVFAALAFTAEVVLGACFVLQMKRKCSERVLSRTARSRSHEPRALTFVQP